MLSLVAFVTWMISSLAFSARSTVRQSMYNFAPFAAAYVANSLPIPELALRI